MSGTQHPAIILPINRDRHVELYLGYARYTVPRLRSIQRISNSLNAPYLDLARYIAFRLCSMHRINICCDIYMCRYIAIYIIMSFGKLISLYEGQFGRGWTRLHSAGGRFHILQKSIFRMMPGRCVSLKMLHLCCIRKTKESQKYT
jgi:hypothetical protein